MPKMRLYTSNPIKIMTNLVVLFRDYIKKLIAFNNMAADNTSVPNCSNVLLPTLLSAYIDKRAPTKSKTFIKMGTMARISGAAYFIMSPPYATTALIPENCLRIITWIAVKMAAGGVVGY